MADCPFARCLASAVPEDVLGFDPEHRRRDRERHGLEQVYGAIANYLGHRAEIDAYLREGHSQYERDREAERRADPAFYRRLRRLVNAQQHQL